MNLKLPLLILICFFAVSCNELNQVKSLALDSGKSTQNANNIVSPINGLNADPTSNPTDTVKLPSGMQTSLTKLPGVGGNIYAHGNSLFTVVGSVGLFISNDDGVTWVLRSPLNGLNLSVGGWTHIAVLNGNIFLANGSTLFFSKDAGMTFSAIPGFNCYKAIEHAGFIYAQCSAGGVTILKLDSNGKIISSVSRQQMDGIPSNYNLQYVKSYGQNLVGVFMDSTDYKMFIVAISPDGVSWTPSNLPSTTPQLGQPTIITSGSKAYLNFNSQLMVSDDDGQSFSKLVLNMPALVGIYPFLAHNNILIFQGYDPILKEVYNIVSEDAGETFVARKSEGAASMTINPKTSDIYYWTDTALSKSSDLFKTPAKNIVSFAPNNDMSLYYGSSGPFVQQNSSIFYAPGFNLYFSKDGGSSFVSLIKHSLPIKAITLVGFTLSFTDWNEDIFSTNFNPANFVSGITSLNWTKVGGAPASQPAPVLNPPTPVLNQGPVTWNGKVYRIQNGKLEVSDDDISYLPVNSNLFGVAVNNTRPYNLMEIQVGPSGMFLRNIYGMYKVIKDPTP